ncbi:MAG: hypothetical protein RIQ47_105 [Bacteroidota bacterium]|jgi:nicotinamide-nucleotide amidase
MKAEILTIGDELLIGQVVDTNSAWIGQQLNRIGVKVHQITSVSDDEQHILKALAEAQHRADVVLITGGLGPTKDDITKKTLCKFFDCGIRFDEPSYQNIVRLFRERGRDVSATNRSQAEVPDGCTVLVNPKGTAPGMWFEKDNTIFVSMPGVPFEMKGIMEHSVIALLIERFSLPPILHRTILTQGIGESMLSDRIVDWENALPKHIKLAYLPAAGTVRMRMTASGKPEAILREELMQLEAQLLPMINEFVYGFDDESLESLVGELLRTKKATIATAESCTGGYLAHRLTAIPGSSDYYLGSLIAYANEIKFRHLEIPTELLEKHGAVSEPVVQLMAERVRSFIGTDYGVATSGIAGPGGATEEKPVGTVWIAVAGPNGVETKLLRLGKGRERVIHETALYALMLLRKILLR